LLQTPSHSKTLVSDFEILLQKRRIHLQNNLHVHQTLFAHRVFGSKIIEVFNSTVTTPASNADGKLTQFVVLLLKYEVV
jgi:hypothetical protein